MEPAVHHWTPSPTVCAIDFYTGDKFPKWTNNLFLATLLDQQLLRLVIRDDKLVSQEVILEGVGRVRDVISGPDGYLYIAFNSPDRIARLAPAK
jgi:glucose/arabinose dehydrogenase